MLNASICPGRRAETHEHPKRPDAIERGRECGFADAVIDDIAELAAGDVLHARDKILIAVKDGVMAAMRLRDLGFVFRSDGADHGCAQRIRPLAQNLADAAGGGVHQHGRALLHFEGAIEQILRGHALEHHARGLLVGNLLRQFHRALRRHQTFRGIGAERHHVSNAIADGDIGDARSDGRHLARALHCRRRMAGRPATDTAPLRK